MLIDFMIGFFYPLQGFSLIIKPGIRKFVLIPLLMNILIFVGFFFLMQHYAHKLDEWFLTLLPSWLAWLSFLFWILFLLSFLIVAIYTFVTVGNLIASPFNSLLAEQIESQLTGTIRSSTPWTDTIKSIPKVVGRQLAIIGYYLPRAILLIILFFVPVVHIFVGILWFLLNARFMALTYFDYPADNQGVPLEKLRLFIADYPGLSYGFGMGILVLMLIPILNFFVIPVAVASGTALWVSRYNFKKML